MTPFRDPRQMLTNGRDFLLSAQRKSGAWKDFSTSAGDSVDWTTAWVARALTGVPGAEAAVGRALRRIIARQRDDGGWGYNGTVPTDADSTAWSVLALQGQPGVRPSVFCRATGLLARHQQADGGFATYAQPVVAPSERPGRITDAGWRSSHVCVTAAVIRALAASSSNDGFDLKGATDYLRRHRGHTGVWTGYWWLGYAYATRQASLALCAVGTVTPAEFTQTASTLARLQVNGGWSTAASATARADALQTALAAATCQDIMPARAYRTAVIERALHWLGIAQLADGSWAADPALRVPRPDRRHPERLTEWTMDGRGFDSVVRDSRRLFTTAAVCEFLAAIETRL
jgi:squalene cyclase